MKNFITCFTLFLMANLAHGQIGSFNFNDGALISTFAVGVAGTNSSASITSISSVAADCAGTASIGRSVTGASATISLTIAPASGYTGLVTFTGIAITLKHDKNAATIGTATVVVNGNPFLGALTFSNTCSTLNFAGGPLDAVTAGSIAIVINFFSNSTIKPP